MQEIILDNIYLILFLPFWIFLIIMGARIFSFYINNKVIYGLTLLASFLGVLLTSFSLANFSSIIENSFPFIKISNFTLYCGIQADKLSLIVALVLFSISFIVEWFSIFYMQKEEKKYKFFAYLNMFKFSMAGLLFSPNLFQLYFFWELVGVMSYLLIGFDYKNNEKSEASRRVFLMNRFGDTCLIGGIIFSSYLMYNYSGNLSFATLSFVDMNAISTLISAYTSTPEFLGISLLFIIGAMVKSAQFPFYTWLQDAMEAKLPVSALLHSATMVVAGAFLIIRLVPIFSLNSNVMTFISYIGIITALVCSILASIETHPKKVLAYSTSANLGLIFLAIGIMNIKAAVIFLVAHALIKSLLFLTLDRNENYINYITFLLGGLSLSGLIFSGVISKEYLFMALENNQILSVLYCIVAFLTAFYIIRIALVMVKDKELINRHDFMRYFPIAILFLMNILFYFISREKVDYKIAEPYWIALVGWVVVYILYIKNLLTKFSTTPKLLENFYNNKLTKFYNNFAYGCRFVDDKIFSNYKPITNLAKYSVNFIGFIENKVMNGSVRLVSNTVRKLAILGAKLQSKNIQTYNAYAFIILTVVITLVIFAYQIMLNQMS